MTAPSPVAHTPRRPWLARLPPGLFAMALGLLGLAGAWRRLGVFDIDGATGVATVLLVVALALLGGLLLLWAAKLALHPGVVKQEQEHPVQGALLALLPLSTLMAVAQVMPLWPEAVVVALPIALAALALMGAQAWQVVARLSTGRMPAELITPALYLPTVAGGFVGAQALSAVGLGGWAALLFGMGVGAWALLEVRILHRLFAGPLPPALRPTLGIEMAPATVGTLALATLWPQLPSDALLVCLGVASGPVLAVLTRWRYWTDVPFSAGFWSFSFPLAAMAGATVEAVRRGSWPVPVAVLAVTLASAVIAYLALRTLLLLLRGKLLPPA